MGAWLKHVKQFLNQFTSVCQENQNSSKMIFSQIHLDQIHLCLQVNGLEVQTNQQSRFLLKVDLLKNQKLNSTQQLLKKSRKKNQRLKLNGNKKLKHLTNVLHTLKLKLQRKMLASKN